MSKEIPLGYTLARGLPPADKIYWDLRRSDELFELIYGKSLVAASRQDGSIPVYGTNAQCGWHSVPSFQGPGIIIGRKGQGSLGVEYCPADYWVIDTAYSLKLANSLSVKHCFCLINYVGLNHLKDGTSNPTLSRDSFGRQLFPIPPEEDQQAIAHILGTLDDKIELNRKTNETLEAMAKALFKSWFVDFDPVRAKAEGRPTGLPAEISDLFQDSFDDSELGEIPSGWSVQSAGSQYQISIGKTPPRKESKWFSTSAADMPWLSIRDLGEIGVYADRASECLMRDAVEKFNIRVVPADTVVLSFKLTIGRVAITGSEMLTNEAIAHFSPLEKRADSGCTYCLLSQYDYHSLGSTSSIATAVNSQMLRDMPLVVPPETIARSFCDATTSIFSSIKCGQREAYCLSDFRDALLPKLISGEIRIPDAEKMLEKVGI